MSDDTGLFEIRDLDLTLRPALARAGGYTAALRQVDRLHQNFYDQVEANGEGGFQADQRLVVVELGDDGTAMPRYWSVTDGLRPAHR
jgi:protein involved in polysaccharide export with SLBB domain